MSVANIVRKRSATLVFDSLKSKTASQGTFLISHGLGGNLESTHGFMKSLSARLPTWNILSLSLPLHNGSSDIDREEWTVPAMLPSIREIITSEEVTGQVVAVGSAFTGYIWLEELRSRPSSKFVSIDWMPKSLPHMTDPSAQPTASTWESYRDKMISVLKEGATREIAEHVYDTMGKASCPQILKAASFVKHSVETYGEPVDLMARVSDRVQILYVSPESREFGDLRTAFLPASSKYLTLELPGEVARIVSSFATE